MGENINDFTDEEMFFCDFITIEAENFIRSEDVMSIDMPKINVNIVNDIPTFEKSPIVITLFDNKSTPSRLLSATKTTIKKMKIVYFEDLEKKVVLNTWVLSNVKIKAINFGTIVTIPQKEKRIIQCELVYDKLNINNVNI